MTNNSVKLTTQELMDDVKSNSGVSGGWPNYFNYSLEDGVATISVDSANLGTKEATRRLDPWGLAFLNYAKRCGPIHAINFVVTGEIDRVKTGGRLVPDMEAFRRRLSFLSINNSQLQFGITINGERLALDEASTLFNRPASEKIHETLERKPQDNTPGRIEKDFQTWLFANEVKKKEDRDSNTNERLAVLGSDFFKLNHKGFGIEREFPTGVFHENISRNGRILPTEYVDIVTLNKRKQLAVIELKLNDSKLEVMAQILDYSLFFACYIERLLPLLRDKLGIDPKSRDIVCYVVNNHFHDRFDEVFAYYKPKYGSIFDIKKVVLGYYT